MAEFVKLRNQVKHYEWGSPLWIPRLLGTSQDGRPWAELWMGSHPAAPSQAIRIDGEIGLGELIAGDPRRYLGTKTAEKWGALPFLFKLLAAERPLSIQAHPNKHQAGEGFTRENNAGLALDAPARNYKDPNHKPEIICALVPFTGMCGFRPPDEIRRLLAAFLAPAPVSLRDAFSPLMRALETPNDAGALRDFFSALFSLSPAAREELSAHIRRHPAADSNRLEAEQWELMRRFAELYPNDPALVSPLYLNIFHLEPGEAVFLRAGVLHAYIHGFGVELMANSDNVLRGGLTSKHVDVPELVNVLDFNPHTPEIIKTPEPSPACFRYPVRTEEFSLQRLSGSGGAAAFAESGPAICIVTEGELILDGERDSMRVLQGESVFIPPGHPGAALTLRGNYTLYAASLP